MALRLFDRRTGRHAGAAADAQLRRASRAQSFSGDYTVSFFGFTVARSTVVSRDRRRATTPIDGTIKSAGLATFFGRTTRGDVGLGAHRQRHA